jgi:hypothetical protein
MYNKGKSVNVEGDTEELLEVLGDILDLCDVKILGKGNYGNMERLSRLGLTEEEMVDRGWEAYSNFRKKYYT